MTHPPRPPRLALAAAVLLASAAPVAAGEPEARQGAWRDCLVRNAAAQASPVGREVAAGTALRACRAAEAAYLAALAESPLLDAGDIERARPALLARARDWLAGAVAAAR